MKKLIFLGSVLALIAIGVISCNKLKEKLFNAFTAKGAEFEFTVPVVTSTSGENMIGTQEVYMNLDSLIKAETSNNFSLNDVDKIRPEEVKFEVLNPDADNNIQNFETGRVVFYSSSNTTELELAVSTNPDVYAESVNLPVDNAVNLKSYLTGTQYFYRIYGKARKVTTKDLNCRLVVKLKIGA